MIPIIKCTHLIKFDFSLSVSLHCVSHGCLEAHPYVESFVVSLNVVLKSTGFLDLEFSERKLVSLHQVFSLKGSRVSQAIKL